MPRQAGSCLSCQTLGATKTSPMTYEVREEVPSVSDYINIRLSAGLSRKSPEAATIGLKNGLFSVVVYSREVPVGIGRVIGDGGCFFEIVDVAVLPEHQKKGLGHLIMQALNEVHTRQRTAHGLRQSHGRPRHAEVLRAIRL
jgi:GNAT superfamily N-acetyltransferase